MPKATDMVIEVCGGYIRVLESEMPIFYDFRSMGGRRSSGNRSRALEYRKSSMRNTQQNLRRLIRANFGKGDKHIVLTFRDGALDDLTDIDQVKKAFGEFLRGLKRLFTGLRYVGTFEMHKERNALHIHLVINLPRVPYETLVKIWKYGRIYVEPVNQNIHKLADYITKQYEYREGTPLSEYDSKRYLSSKGLKQPTEFRGIKAQSFLKSNSHHLELLNQSSYISDFHGQIYQYEFFNESFNQVFPKAKRIKKEDKKAQKLVAVRKILQKNPKTSVRNIARQLNISVGGAHALIKEVQSSRK